MTPHQRAMLHSPALPSLIARLLASLGYLALGWVAWDWKREWDETA